MNRIYRVAVVVLLGLFASGCATKQYHDWYQGEQNQAAVLKSNNTILIDAINGKEAEVAFIGQKHSYELAPGRYTLLVSYADMYDLTADDFEKVKSNPVKMTFSAEPGKTYQLVHREIADVRDARQFAEKPELKIQDAASGAYVAVELEHTIAKSFLPKVLFASEEEKVFASDYQQSAGNTAPANVEPATKEELSALKMLQFSWKNASPKEREAFMQWVEQQ